jgi:CubicO group peptidase (beta-lactamase class C family)
MGAPMRVKTRSFAFCLVNIAALGSPLAPAAVAEPTGDARAARIDDRVHAEMQKRRVPGLSLAILEGGKIVKATGYGVTEKGGANPVTTSTLFQAGSISKPVSALAALRLAEQGKLALDEDVNAKLVSWKVPDSQLIVRQKVELRGLLSHTAGLTVIGFPGYATDQPMPTLVQILNGEKPANTAAIRVDVEPGSIWRYSGGGYTVMQQLIVDVTGKPFPQFMHETVLEPLGMNESTFVQPLPVDKAKLTASGQLSDRSPVKGRWHIYPELAAAGLWTTPSDLVRFAAGIQRALAGEGRTVITPTLAEQMVTSVKDNYGLGVSVRGSGTALKFGHGGRDLGFDAFLLACARTGQAAAIMINANDNTAMVTRIMDAIAREYHWPGLEARVRARLALHQIPKAKLAAISGRYELANNQMFTLGVAGDHLVSLVDGLPDEEFVPQSDAQFASANRDVSFTIDHVGGEITALTWHESGQERKAPRIGPLFHTLKPQSDPDSARTEKVRAAMKAFAVRGKAVADSPLLTAGAREELSSGPPLRWDVTKPAVFLAEQDVSSRSIVRHKSPVAKVLHYRQETGDGVRCLLVHLTADGLLTDYDLVDD